MSIEAMLEAERRGILPAEKASLLEEARKRGLVSEMGIVQPQEDTTLTQDIKSWWSGFKQDFEGAAPSERTGEALRKKDEGTLISMGKGFDKSLSGMKQAGLEAGEKIGILEKGQAEAFTKMKDDEYLAFEQAFEGEFGESFAYTAGQLIGEVAPAMAIPGGQATAAARLGALTAGGALVGGTTYIPEESEATRGQLAATGAGTALAFGSAFEVVPKAKNFIKKWLGKGLDSKFAKEGVELSKKTGVDFKLSQLTGQARSEALETAARGSSEGEMLARELESRQALQLKSYFTKIMNKLKPDSTRLGESVAKTFDDVLGDATKRTGMLGNRAAQAERDFTRAYAAGGRKADIPMTNFRKAIDDLLQEHAGAASRFPGSESAKVVREMTALKQGAQENITALDIHNMLKQFGKASEGRGKALSDALDITTDQGLSKRLYGALKNDAEAAPQLGKAMANYAKNTDEIEALRQSALGKIFDVKEGSLTPEAIERAFTKMDATSMKQAVAALKKVDPAIKQRIQSHFISEKLQKAGLLEEAGKPSFQPSTMLDLVNDNRKQFLAVFGGKGFNDIKRGLEAAQRVIQFNRSMGGGAGLTGEAIKFAGVIASRDKTFIARLAAEVATPTGLQRLVESESARKALMELTKPGAKQKSVLLAVDQLSELIAGEPEIPLVQIRK